MLSQLTEATPTPLSAQVMLYGKVFVGWCEDETDVVYVYHRSVPTSQQ